LLDGLLAEGAIPNSDIVDAANPPLRDEAAVEKADRQILKYEQLLKPCFKAN